MLNKLIKSRLILVSLFILGIVKVGRNAFYKYEYEQKV